MVKGYSSMVQCLARTAAYYAGTGYGWIGGSVVRWLVIERSQVRLPASPLASNNSGPVVHTHVPLSPRSIIWYRPMGSDALQLGR